MAELVQSEGRLNARVDRLANAMEQRLQHQEARMAQLMADLQEERSKSAALEESLDAMREHQLVRIEGGAPSAALAAVRGGPSCTTGASMLKNVFQAWARCLESSISQLTGDHQLLPPPDDGSDDGGARGSSAGAHEPDAPDVNPGLQLLSKLLCGLFEPVACSLPCGIGAKAKAELARGEAPPRARAAAAGGAAARGGRARLDVLGGAAPALGSSLVGEDDLELDAMADGIRPMIRALETLGSWTFVAVSEMNSNLSKLAESAAVQRLAADGAPRHLLAVLDAEAAARLHPRGGPLKPHSAAEGLLWLTRFLVLWRELWREPRPPTFKAALDRAYELSIKPYHSWVLQRTFAMSTASVGDWPHVLAQLDAFDVAGEAGLLPAVEALDPVLGRIEQAMRARGMWTETPI
jgi:hypothetical protein